MSSVFIHNQRHVNAGSFQFAGQHFALTRRNRHIILPMDDEKRRIALAHIGCRTGSNRFRPISFNRAS